ncbi:MAG: hypothetical protein C3F17_10835 [Bradyrhizobiaceae bacterium]|nr:MAG: hypothetical protein C3F17_10835 [Bradyrhizobiaceae bacterium]
MATRRSRGRAFDRVGLRMIRSVDLRIHNDMSEIGVVRDALDDLARQHAIPRRALTQLQVALDEIVSNVVKYSWEDGGRHEFLVRITVRSGGVDLEIIDDGRQFDPLTIAAPATVAAGRRPRPGGLGIHMARKLVDQVTYVRVDGRNHTTLSKACEVDVATQGSGK